MAKSDGETAHVLEEGDIFFLYRPEVEEDDPESLGDVQRFHIVLRPRGGDRLRLLVVGRKRMPDVERHERNWGFVDAVTSSSRKIEQALQEIEYGTKTRGERRLPAVRPSGEGVYAITLEDSQMYLIYSLELPEEPGDVQKSMNIAPEGRYALSVKNPEAGQPKAAGLRTVDKADYPRKLQEEFRGRRFGTEDAALMDYEGAEFILVGAREQARGADLDAADEDYEHADTVRRLRMVKSRHPVAPLFEGRWE